MGSGPTTCLGCSPGATLRTCFRQSARRCPARPAAPGRGGGASWGTPTSAPPRSRSVPTPAPSHGPRLGSCLPAPLHGLPARPQRGGGVPDWWGAARSLQLRLRDSTCSRAQLHLSHPVRSPWGGDGSQTRLNFSVPSLDSVPSSPTDHGG